MNIPLNIDWQQILLHLMNFVILAGGLYFLLYKPVKAFMDKRAAYYQERADQAAQTTQAAQQLKADYEARLSAADDEIREEKKQAQKDAAAAAQQQLDAESFGSGTVISPSTVPEPPKLPLLSTLLLLLPLMVPLLVRVAPDSTVSPAVRRRCLRPVPRSGGKGGAA